jgi:hypothetical protein
VRSQWATAGKDLFIAQHLGPSGKDRGQACREVAVVDGRGVWSVGTPWVQKLSCRGLCRVQIDPLSMILVNIAAVPSDWLGLCLALIGGALI